MDFRRGHRVTNVFRKRSQGHGRISAVTNCDPGRGRMHCAYGSDHPLRVLLQLCIGRHHKVKHRFFSAAG